MQKTGAFRFNRLMKSFFEHMSRRDFLRFTAAGAAAAILPGCTKTLKPSGSARHVIIISLDTARADCFGCYGNDWIQTPNIDRLAEESIVFTDCMTASSTTLSSHVSLFTGEYPHIHGVPRNGFVVNAKNNMLPEVLKSAGFHTAGFVAAMPLSSRFNFSQGFDHFDEEPISEVPLERIAGRQTEAVLAYLEKTKIPSNLFLFAHYFDAHKPYTPPEKYRKIYENNPTFKSWLDQNHSVWNKKDSIYHKLYAKDPAFGKRLKEIGVRLDEKWNKEDEANAIGYAGEITYMDKQVGRLLDNLKKKGILDQAILIVTSDHGENFKEHHAWWNHGYSVYQTAMQSVCMIRLPRAKLAGSRNNQLLSNIDLFPTILSYLGLKPSSGISGEAVDLSPPSGVISLPDRIRFGEASKPFGAIEMNRRWYNNRKAKCVRDGNHKYIKVPYIGLEELYDLPTDPLEQVNLLDNPSSAIQKKANVMREKVRSWAKSADPLSTHFEEVHKHETVEQLKALGYL